MGEQWWEAKVKKKNEVKKKISKSYDIFFINNIY